MENYVVSRELAEKLKAAGYPQDTKFKWCSDGSESPDWNLVITGSAWLNRQRDIAAPLSDELLEQLPFSIHPADKDGLGHQLAVWKYLDDYQASYFGKSEWYKACSADKPADGLAELWLWCKENGYLNILKGEGEQG